MLTRDENRDLYDRLNRHIGVRAARAAGLLYDLAASLPIRPTGMPFEPYDQTRTVLINTVSPIGQLTILPNTVIIHPRDVIRLDHPPGITGELTASLEWINRTIALAAARATTRIEAMHR